MASCVSGKWLEVDEIVEKICMGHRLHGPFDSWTVLASICTAQDK
jgi:hypothetical protein